jgi:hypothetical protein
MRSARPSIVAGSLADRIRTACPAGVGATLREIERVALARSEDVRAELVRLRSAGYVRVSRRGRAGIRTTGRPEIRYFWRRTNRRRAGAS